MELPLHHSRCDTEGEGSGSDPLDHSQRNLVHPTLPEGDLLQTRPVHPARQVLNIQQALYSFAVFLHAIMYLFISSVCSACVLSAPAEAVATGSSCSDKVYNVVILIADTDFIKR